MRQKRKLFNCIVDMPYGYTSSYQMFDAAKNSRDFVQKLQLQRKLPVHEGCVNSIVWNESGTYLLSGSDDQHLSIVHGYDYSALAYIRTGHRSNIFSAKFLPNAGDKHIISCSGDGVIIYSDLDRVETSLHNKFNCHKGTAYELVTVPNDPNTFLSCGEDKSVRWFDLRTKTSCIKEDCKEDILISCQAPVTSIAVNPLTPYQFACGCADSSVRIYDRRMICTHNSAGLSISNGTQAMMACFTVPDFKQSRRITSLCYSNDGQEMLVSYSSDYIYLFDVKDDLKKAPRHLGKNGIDDPDLDLGLYYRGRPLMKRLRIRGDWSDTGPNARPEAEQRLGPVPNLTPNQIPTVNEAAEPAEEPSSSRSTIVRTMTNILTRMLNSNQSQADAPGADSPSATRPVEDETSEPLAATVLDSAAETTDRTLSVSATLENESNDGEYVNNRPEGSNDTEVPDDAPGTSSPVKNEEEPSIPVPSTPCDNSTNEEVQDDSNTVKNEDDHSPRTSKTDLPLCGDAAENNELQSIENTLESRRKDLIEKHQSEPMVDLHYSGQSVSSGQITMNVASSSTANERQWLEQSTSDLPDSADNASVQVQPNELSDIQTGDAPQTEEASSSPITFEIHPETSFRPIQPPADDVPSPEPQSSPNLLEAASSSENPDVELVMDVDYLEMSSDEDVASPRTRNLRRHLPEEVPPRLVESLCDEVADSEDELGRVDGHMPNVCQPRVRRKFTGHRNARTMIKEANFWGDDYVMSGSDCGHIFVWDRHTTELVMLLEADHHVVNCLQPHPFDPILASSGIDYDIKLWSPLREEPYFDWEKAREITQRNQVMLEETKDTITVPASFMFRMFQSLNNFRSGRAYRWSRAARAMRATHPDSSRR